MADDVRFINGFVSGDRLVLLYRNAAGKLSQKNERAEYSCFVKKADATEAKLRDVKRSRAVLGVVDEGDWLRIRWRDEWVRREACRKDGWFETNGMPTYEGDVSPVRRYLTDTGAHVARPKRCYLDIETDSRKPIAEALKGEARVLCWTVVGQDGEEASGLLETDDAEDEARMLNELWAALEPYDQVCAWYGDGFDFVVICERSKRLKLPNIARNVMRICWLDHLALFKRMNMHAAESGEEKQSMALNAIAHAVLGEGKDETPDFVAERFGKKKLGELSWQLWEAGGEFRDVLMRYNVRDTVLLKKLDDKTGYIDLFVTICEVCRLFPNTEGLNPTHQVDGFMLRLGLERGHHFVSKFYGNNESEKFKGAFVMEPTCKGIARNVHVGDFASLYPSIIITWNMSPETKDRGRVPVSGPIPPGFCRSPSTRVAFTVETPGILPSALAELLRLRKEWNEKKASLPPGTPAWVDADRRSNAYKVAANSFYGVMGSPFSRYFDKELAESVTQNGAWLIKRTIEEAERRHMEAVYGDTDSLFIRGATEEQFREFVAWCNKDLYPRIIAETGCVTNLIKLAYEKEFERIVFTSAKRYVGRYVHYKGKRAEADSKPEVKGLEWKRGDVLALARHMQGEVIQKIVAGEERPEAYEEIVLQYRTRVLDGQLALEDVALSKSLSKNLNEYSTRAKKDGTAAASPPHVQVARVLKQRGRDVSSGTRIEYVVVDGDASPQKVIPAEDFDGKFDRFYLWESLVYPASHRLIAAAFPAEDWDKWASARPPKQRGKAAASTSQTGLFAPAAPAAESRVSVASKKAPTAGQLALGIAPMPAKKVAAKVPEPLLLVLDSTLHDEAVVTQLRDIMARNPGPRLVTLEVRTPAGDAVLSVKRGIDTSEETAEDLLSIVRRGMN